MKYFFCIAVLNFDSEEEAFIVEKKRTLAEINSLLLKFKNSYGESSGITIENMAEFLSMNKNSNEDENITYCDNYSANESIEKCSKLLKKHQVIFLS